MGHEVLAVFDVAFPPGAFANETRIGFREDNGEMCFAEWFDLETLDRPGRPQLYPEGLRAHLQRS